MTTTGSKITERFPQILEVSLIIGYDNGIINRFCSKQEFIDERVEPVLGMEGVYEADLEKLEAWVATLTEEEKHTLACGESDDIDALEAASPQWDSGGSMCSLFSLVFEP